MAKQMSMPQPPPPQVNKSNRLVAVAIVMLLIGVAIGVAVGWSIGQSRSQAVQSELVTVMKGSSTSLKLRGYDYYFYYKQTITGYDPQKPIEIDVQGLQYTLPATQGSRYNVAGIEVVISEVHDDYIILLVKPL